MEKKKDSFSSKLSFKFILLGDQVVGKTDILERYANNSIKSNYLTTIGMDKTFVRLEINNTDVDVFITDTAGEERFRSLTKMFYKGADGILVGFSLVEPKTLESIDYWISQIKENCTEENPISLVLFGTKCDEKENIKVKQEDIDTIKNKYNLTYFEVSAKENINIQNLFEYLIKTTIKKKGYLKNIGLPEDTSLDDIKIMRKKNQELKQKIKKEKLCLCF